MTSNAEAGSLRRGVLLLKLLATAGRRGLALTELATKAQLPHPSAHRILRQLMVERLAQHDARTRRYTLGPLAFEIGVASSSLYDIRDLCEAAMNDLANATEDTVYLVVRSGFDAVCMHRREGAYPVRALVLEVGSRRPLGVGAGGLAILSAIEPEEREDIIERVAPNLLDFGDLTAEALRLACAQAAGAGAAVVQNRVSLGVTAVGMHFRNSVGQPTGALSVAALSHRMSTSRVEAVGGLVRKAVEAVTQRMFSLQAASRRSI